jgi:hypothetical protein
MQCAFVDIQVCRLDHLHRGILKSYSSCKEEDGSTSTLPCSAQLLA